MSFFKGNIEKINSQVFSLNREWLPVYKEQHPQDTLTTAYCETTVWGDYGYVIKDEVTEAYVLDFIEVVEKIPEVEIFDRVSYKEGDTLLIVDGKPLEIIETSKTQIISAHKTILKEWLFSQNFDLSGITLWQDLVGQFVKKGKLVVHNGILYIVDGPHTFQSDWPPNLAISLFSTHWPDGVIGPWRQPNGAHDSYKMGMRVTHNGFIWEVNQVDANGHNVWKPGVFGWMNIGQVDQPEEPGDPEPPANPCDGIALWDSTQDWNSYVTGELRKWEIGGVMKVFSCNSKQWAYIEPGQPYSGWKYEYDCPA